MPVRWMSKVMRSLPTATAAAVITETEALLLQGCRRIWIWKLSPGWVERAITNSPAAWKL